MSSEIPGFTLPKLSDNTRGWGPSSLASVQMKDSVLGEIPYTPYSKSDKVNRVANWINPADQQRNDQRDGGGRGRGGKHGRDNQPQTYGSNTASAFVYQMDEDEDSFSLVDNSRGPSASGAGGGTGGQGGARKIGIRAIHGSGGGNAGQGGRGRGARGMQRLGQRGGRMGGYAGGMQRRRWNNWYDRDQQQRYASVRPTDDWSLVQNIEFNRMKNLSFAVDQPRDIGFYGKAGVYVHSYDRVNTRLEKPLKSSGSARYNVMASDDPVLVGLSENKSKQGVKVFATDSVISTLMAANVSASAWDVVVNRIGDKVFLDKRDGGPLDFPSVNENARDPPTDALTASGERDTAAINSASMLSKEARDVAYSCIKQVTSGSGEVKYDNPNPFNEDDDGDDNAYRYRLFDLSLKSAEAGEEEEEKDAAGDASKCLMAVRTEVDGVLGSGAGQKQLFIRALTQHDINSAGAGGALDWRQRLDAQRGVVMATEMKNNATKLARWSYQAMLAGADQIKLAFVARSMPNNRARHGILGFQTYRPADFITQLGYNQYSAWGIIKALVDMCLGLDEGRYVIMRDPNMSCISVYSVPAGTFDKKEDDE